MAYYPSVLLDVSCSKSSLFSQGYRDKSHHCLYAALKALYVRRGLMDSELAEAFYHAMILRENADYRSRFSKSGAMAVLKRAEEFLNCVKKIILRSSFLPTKWCV